MRTLRSLALKSVAPVVAPQWSESYLAASHQQGEWGGDGGGRGEREALGVERVEEAQGMGVWRGTGAGVWRGKWGWEGLGEGGGGGAHLWSRGGGARSGKARGRAGPCCGGEHRGGSPAGTRLPRLGPSQTPPQSGDAVGG